MYKIAVIGDKDSVMGFKALGLEVHFSKTSETSARLLHSLAKEGYALIYITENAAADIMDEIDKYKDSRLPAIILIPGGGKSLGIGMSGIKKSVERAVGADILFKE